MSSPLETIAERLRQHPKLVIADDFEIAIQSSTSSGLRYHNGELRSRSQGHRLWLSLRILHRKRGGKAAILNPSLESLNLLVESAFDAANRAAVDPWFRFPIWKTISTRKDGPTEAGEQESSLFSEVPNSCAFFDETYDWQKSETLLRRKTERSELRHQSRAHFSTLALLADPGEGVFFLKEERAGTQALAERAAWVHELVHAAAARSKKAPKPCGKGKRKVVLSPRVAARLLRAMAPWFSAEAVQSGRSPLREMLGQKIFGDALTLVDDGTCDSAPGWAPFDLEGVVTQKTVLVDRGTVKSWLFDVYTATRENRLSTGNFLRSPVEMSPSVQASCLVFQPGEKSRQGLLEEMGNGVWLENLDTLDVRSDASGLVRLRGSGWRVAFGQCSEPLSEIDLEMDLRTFWRSAVGVGRDLSFFAGSGSPSILVEGVPLGS